jgi:hypothetical protein
MIECRLVSHERQTAFGGLCALGHFLAQEGALQPLSGVKIDQKTVKHSPAQKLTDALVGRLSGGKAIYETNARVRPDVPLSRAFGRERVAEQSTIQRTLDAFSEENVCELREGQRTSAPLGDELLSIDSSHAFHANNPSLPLLWVVFRRAFPPEGHNTAGRYYRFLMYTLPRSLPNRT